MKKAIILAAMMFLIAGYAQGITFENVESVSKIYGVAVNASHSRLVDYRMHVDEGTFTLASTITVEDTTFDATTGHGISIGDLVYLQEDGRMTELIVLGVATDTISVDTPIDYAFTTSAVGVRGVHDLTFDGSVTSVKAHIAPPAGVIWKITRVMFYMEDDVAMDDAKFGGIAALTKGCVFTVKGVNRKVIFNVKTNGEMAERMYDVTYSDKAAAGKYGLRGRRTFAGISKNSAYIELDGDAGDAICFVIQDDLTDLDHLHLVVQGSVK